MRLAALLVAVLAGPATAVKTAIWSEHEPDDLSKGRFEQTVWTNLGQIRLGPQVQQVFSGRDDVGYVHSLAEGQDGTVYVGTGPEGVLLKVVGEAVSELFRAPGGGNVWSLLISGGKVLAGVDGTAATIYAVDPASGKGEVFFRPAGARYVWAMVQGEDGTVYAATGPAGKLFAIQPDGTGRVIYARKGESLLSLAIDRRGRLLIGTGGEGLVIRLEPATGKSFVLYDAAEQEISSLVVDGAGNVYAATAAAELAKPGLKPPARPGGKPEVPAAAATQPAAERARSAGTSKPSAIPARPAKPLAVGLPPARKPGQKEAAGNAVYRIGPSGFVTEVFRQPVTILCMVQADGRLIVGTGNEGRIYQIDPAAEEVAVLARLGSNQVSALLRTRGGLICAGTANAAGLHVLSAGYAARGTFVSRVLDAGQICRWGHARVWASKQTGTEVRLATRSGNLAEPDEATWSDWSAEMPTDGPVAISSPPARFLQYRLTLTTSDRAATPVIEKVELARLEDNRPPRVQDIRLVATDRQGKPRRQRGAGGDARPGRRPRLGAPQPQDLWLIKWVASDPNDDRLIYDLYFRQADRTGWILLAEDLDKPQHLWDTRSVADGRYYIRVVAKDQPDNPPRMALSGVRISDLVVVDNSPPQIRDVQQNPAGSDGIRISARLADRWTNIVSCHYSVDSHDEWVAVLPIDGIFDSPEEAVRFTIEGLSAGQHTIAIRAVDQQDNAGYAVLAVTIEAAQR